MDIIRLPFYIVLYSYRALASTARWTGRALLWAGIFAGIYGVHYAISYVTESRWPASILYGAILAAAYIRYRLDR